jgi:hypothetical protein
MNCDHRKIRVEFEVKEWDSLIECVEAKVVCISCRHVLKKEPALMVRGLLQGHVEVAGYGAQA